MTEDRRPAFVLDDVRDVEFHNVRAAKVEGVPTFTLRAVEDFRTYHSRGVADTIVTRTERDDL